MDVVDPVVDVVTVVDAEADDTGDYICGICGENTCVIGDAAKIKGMMPAG